MAGRRPSPALLRQQLADTRRRIAGARRELADADAALKLADRRFAVAEQAAAELLDAIEQAQAGVAAARTDRWKVKQRRSRAAQHIARLERRASDLEQRLDYYSLGPKATHGRGGAAPAPRPPSERGAVADADPADSAMTCAFGQVSQPRFSVSVMNHGGGCVRGRRFPLPTTCGPLAGPAGRRAPGRRRSRARSAARRGDSAEDHALTLAVLSAAAGQLPLVA
jgi:hypothetical protein